jgi:2,3-bisphosphoglycerate-dependent phosphoglycerate mutase
MADFYLVRHAHADWAPDEQRPLSSRGQEDALRVAELLCGLPITRIYSSPYRRALQTVTLLASRVGLPVQVEPDLRERELGNAPGEYDFLAAVKQTWQNPAFSFAGGEPNFAAQRRGIALVQRLQVQFPVESLVLSTHGNLLALVLQHYDPRMDYAFWKALTMPDVYLLSLSQAGEWVISRLWAER